MSKRFVNRILLVLVSLTTLYLLTTCAKKIINDNTTTGIEFKIAVEYSTAELADLIVKYRVTISASDMETITAMLEEKDGVVRGEVKDVPEGSGRNILLEALDEKDTVIYAGSVDTSIVAGQTVTVKIHLEPVVRMVRLAPKFSSAQSTDSFTVEVRACNISEPSEFELVVKIYPPAVIVTDVVGDYVSAWHHGICSDTPQVKIDVVVDPIPSQTGDDPWCLGLATLVCSCRVADICIDTTGLSVDVITLVGDSTKADSLYEDGMTVTIGGHVLDVTPDTLSFRISAPGPYLHGEFSIEESCGNGDIPYNLAIDESVDWFTVSSQSGLTPAVCTVGINTAGMAYETSYFDSIRVGSQLATDTSYVHVLLEIGQCPPPLPPGSPVGQIGHLYGDTVATLIMWLQSGSPDVAGYNVYKSVGTGSFVIINDSLITQNPMDPGFGNFLHIDYDLNTTSQVRLRYYVTAVSDSGCESSSSDTITFVPADISDSSQTRVQNLQPADGWFASDIPTFTWNSEPGAESYMILLTPVTPGNDPAIWLYRHTDTSFQLGEQLGMTYMPLATAHSPLVGGQLYRFQVYPINSDRAIYRWGEATFEAIGPEGFTGIMQTDSLSNLLGGDTTDWQPPGEMWGDGVWPAYPNPTQCYAVIPFQIGGGSPIIEAYMWLLRAPGDTIWWLGPMVRGAGNHAWSWHLVDQDSSRVPPGIYRLCITFDDYRSYGDIQVMMCSTVATPTLISPEDGATGVDLLATLTWHSAEHAGSYSVEMSSDNLMTPSDTFTVADTVLVRAIDPMDTLYWRVRAQSCCDTADWSPVWWFTPTETGCSTVVTFPDAVLDSVIRSIINVPSGDICAEYLGIVDTISNWGLGVSDLSGLEYCTNLRFLGLSQGTISSLTPLSGLTALTRLELQYNQIEDISPVTGLTGLIRLDLLQNSIDTLPDLSALSQLSYLRLSGNQIRDISGLAGLNALDSLYLSSNDSISDISYLSGLTSLNVLSLNSNSVSDIEPLILNSGIGDGDRISLPFNPLDSVSLYHHVPELMEREAWVRTSNLVRNKSLLEFTAVIGGPNPDSQFVTFDLAGDCKWDFQWFNAGGSSSWLTMDLLWGIPQDVCVRVNISGLTFGDYYDTIRVVSLPYHPDDTVKVAVHLSISGSDTLPAPTSPLGLMGYTEHGDTIMTVFMWIEPDYHDIAGYNVYKSVGGGVFDTLNDSLITENPIDPAWPNCLWADYGVDTSSTVVHRYYIKTVNSAGLESETSDTISFVPADLWQAMHGGGGPWIENLRPRDGLFGSTSPTFSWDPVTGNQGYLMMLKPTGPEGEEPVIWFYRSNATSTQLGETGGLTYIPLEYSPLIAGTYYLFVVFAINTDNTVYMTSDGSTFEVIGPDGFTGITRTDEFCVVDSSEVDTSDWCEDCGGGLLPPQICLLPACPNPASDSTRIRYSMPSEQYVYVYILSFVNGEDSVVKDAVQGTHPAGDYIYTWDLTDNNHNPVDTGIYRCLIETESGFRCYGDIRITDCTILSVPGLVSPINGDTGVSHTPTLIWHYVDGADNYEVEVDSDSTFTDSPASGYIADTTVEAQIPVSGTVYWHVRALSACDTSAWSETWHFTTTGSTTDSVCVSLWLGEDSCVDISNPFATGEVYVGLYMNAAEQLGGFDLLIDYDPTLSFEMATIATTEIEAWEYFNYSLVGSNRIRLLAIADIDNGPSHPPSESLTPNGLAVLLQFFVPIDTNLYGMFLPIDFYWMDCGDNILSDVSGNELFVDLQIYSAESVLVWDEDDDINYPEGSRPAGVGFSDVCLAGNPDAHRCAVFQHGGVCVAEPASCTTVWNAADAGLEAAVRDHIGKPTDTVWVCDVDTITSLDASARNISDLGGIQHLIALNMLNLNNNQITDIDSLSGLTSLNWLYLGYNQIDSIHALAGLTSLSWLNLGNNQIDNIDSLAGLDSLVGLYLAYNQITDIRPLVDNAGIDGGDDVYVHNNPLSDSSISFNIPTLTDRDVTVHSNYLSLDPDTLYFEADSGGTNPAAQQVLVSEAGNVDSLDYAMTNYPPWLWLTNPSDTTPGSTMVYVNISGLSVGDYFDSIEVTSAQAYYSPKYVYCSLVVSDPGSGLVFPDTGLESAIRDHISKPTGSIYLSDVDTITILHANGRFIFNLEGVQHLAALEMLWLTNNQITNISLLAGLPTLNFLDLGGGNQITDISPLSGLTLLSTLYLYNNQIADISPLVDNSGIDGGDIVYVFDNPLSDSSISFHIPTLTDRGVTVHSNHFRLDPQAINFTADIGGPNPAAETLRVYEAGGIQVLNYTISESIPWCSVGDSTSNTPETTTVHADISGLAAGNYSGYLIFTSGAAYNSPETVLVNLHISDTTTAAFSLDSVSGASGSTIPTGQEVTFYIHMKGDDSTWGTISNGFRVYSPDGAQWDTTMADTISHGWYPGMFNLGFWINSFSADGLAADTVVFAGTILSTPGLPAWFDETAYTLTIGPISPSDHGKTICLDSCWYPPAGNWFWQTLGGYRIAPGWDGPHCFTIDSGGIACGNVDGNVGGAGPIDVADLTYLIAYLFQGGPAPPSYVAANMDLCDNVDVGDGIYLNEYLFTGGNPPCGGSVDCGFAPSGDSVELVVIRRPDVTTGNDTLQLDLYVRNGQNLYGGSVGFSWDNANMQMYNATASSLVTTAFPIGPYLYEDDAIATTNSQKRFLFGTSRVGFGGLAADPGQARLWASYYFTLSSWSASDSIVIDTLTFNDGSTYKLVNDSLNGYAPAWKGRLVIKDTSVTSFYGYVIETGGSPLSSALVKLRYVAPAGPVINMDTTNGSGYFEFANITTEPFVIDVRQGGYYPSKTIDVMLGNKGMMSVLSPLGSVTATAEWVDLWCASADNPQFGGYPLQPGDVVEARDPDGVLCGQVVVTSEGAYGYMHVYGDDVATPGVDEGCTVGDTISVYVNGVQVTPDPVPVWTAHGSSHEACF